MTRWGMGRRGGRCWPEPSRGALTPDICQRLCQCIRTTSTAATRLWWAGGKVKGQGGRRDRLLLGVCVCVRPSRRSHLQQPRTPALCLCRALRSREPPGCRGVSAGGSRVHVVKPGMISQAGERSAAIPASLWGQQSTPPPAPSTQRRLFFLSHVSLSSSVDFLHLTSQSASQQGELLVSCV